MLRGRQGASGLVVVDRDAPVLARIDPVGTRGEAKALDNVERALDLGIGGDAAEAAHWLSRGEPARETLEALPPEGLDHWRPAKLGEMPIGPPHQLPIDVGWQRVRMLAREIVQRLMHDLAAQGRVWLSAERLQPLELENVAREDLIGIGDPFLDARHAQTARP